MKVVQASFINREPTHSLFFLKLKINKIEYPNQRLLQEWMNALKIIIGNLNYLI